MIPLIAEILNKVRKLRTREPVGIIRAWPNSSAPKHWLECDGSALESANYPILFSVIGTRFGDGTTGLGATGSTDFNLPDLRGRFVRGYDNGSGNDAEAADRGNNTAAGGTSISGQATGDNIGSIQGDTLIPHTHRAIFNRTGNLVDIGGGYFGDRHQPTEYSATGGADTRPPNISCMYIIRV